MYGKMCEQRKGIDMNSEFNMRQQIVDEIRQLAEECCADKVILFGSRARGDHKERSDIDLAVTGGDSVRFAVDADEVINTLLMFDVVNLDGVVQEALRQSIEREGKTIYEKV